MVGVGTCLGQVVGHARKGARETAKFVAVGQGLLGAEVTGRDLSHALGQHQQRPQQLVAQDHRQHHRAKHRQEQGQGECADVHAAQAVTPQRPLLVFAVRGLNRQSVGHQHIGQGTDDLQKPR